MVLNCILVGCSCWYVLLQELLAWLHWVLVVSWGMYCGKENVDYKAVNRKQNKQNTLLNLPKYFIFSWTKNQLRILFNVSCWKRDFHYLSCRSGKWRASLLWGTGSELKLTPKIASSVVRPNQVIRPLRDPTLKYLPYEQRFLSCMAFNVFEVIRLSVA